MATYPTHGVHLRQRHPNRWLLLAIVVGAALVGVGAWALVDHYIGGTTKTTTGPATLTSSGVANEYIAALERLQPSALTPILAKNAISIDWAYGSGPPFRSAQTLESNWAGVIASSGVAHFRGSLRAAAPNWAAVTWRFRGSTNPITYQPFTMNGLSILDVKHGKVVRETYYWDVPGRNPGSAATVGRKYAANINTHDWAILRSLFSNSAIGVDMSQPVQARNANRALLTWQEGLTQVRGSLRTAGPSFRMDNGKMRNGWAVIDWVAKSASSGGKVSGVSILQLNKEGKIIGQTVYY